MNNHVITVDVVVSLCAVLPGLFTACSDNAKDYNQARTDCADFLESYRAELTELAENADDGSSGEYKKYEYHQEESWGMNYVIFDFDAQGALGGQYCGIYYSPDNEFCDEYGVEELDEDGRYYREDGENNFLPQSD